MYIDSLDKNQILSQNKTENENTRLHRIKLVSFDLQWLVLRPV